MVIEISESDFQQIEDAIVEIKANVCRLRIYRDDRDGLLEKINYQANRIATLLENGVPVDINDIEQEVEARR